MTPNESSYATADQKPPSAPDVTERPATLPVVRISVWLESIRSRASTYRKEDNGDKSEWSIYNQGRADALKNVIEDVRRMISNDPSSATAEQNQRTPK